MLILPDELREVLSSPLGALFVKDTFWRTEYLYRRDVVTVGDIVTMNYMKAVGRPPPLAFIDMKTKRTKHEETNFIGRFDMNITVRNPRGSINIEGILDNVSEAVVGFPDYKVLIIVDGEEDLIPLLLAYLPLPAGTLVIYGQPDAGVVAFRLGQIYMLKLSGITSIMKRVLSPIKGL